MSILLEYVERILKPNNETLIIIPPKINKISNVIKSNTNLSLKMVIPGGSYAKGTMLKHKPDIDLVLVFNKEPGISRNWKALMNKVYDFLLLAFPEAEIVLGDNIAIHLKFKNQNINFDIVPSYYVNSPLQMASAKNSKIYQGITSIWHIKYWNQNKNIPLIKETVMLLKDWKNEHGLKQLKSFHIELIAAHAFHYRLENKYTIDTFLIACFQDIQGMIDGSPIFPVNWEYFDVNDIEDHYDFALLIDPANPRENLLEILETDVDMKNQIKSEASKAISNIENTRYDKVFDPKNKTKFFKK